MRRRMLFAGVLALACASGAATVTSGTLSVELDEGAKGAVTRLATAHGADLGPAAAAVPLFTLRLTRTDDFTKSAWVQASEAASFACEKTADGLKLTYCGLGEACAEVVCTVRGGGELVRWGVAVTPKPGWALEETTYPRLLLSNGLGTSPDDDCFVVGSAKGGVTRNPGAKGPKWWARAKQPGPLVAQFATLYDDRAGFYLAAEDAAGHVKDLGASGAASGLEFSVRRLGFDAAACRQAFDVVTGGFEGTPANPCSWHDAADIYKRWAVKQAWCAKPFRARDDVPAWMRDAPAMVRFTREWLQAPDAIRGWMRDYWLKEYPAAPLVMAYWGWEKIGNWVTPEYFPVVPDDETFAKLVKDMRALGGHAFPWPSGYHWTTTYDKREDGTFKWDDRARFARVGEAHAVVNRDGKRYVRTPSWLRGGDCACLCGGDPWTIDWWNRDVCLPLTRLGCEMIQVDQVVGGAWPSCWAKHHPHGPGEGVWKTDSFRRQLVTMRDAMRAVERDAVVCFEEPNEHFNHLVGIQDYRDCESRCGEWASVFNYLYHEYLPCFQSNPRRGNRMWQAHEAADGQIPFLSPAMGDGKGPMPALRNGDFELVRADGEAFPGWEKLAGYRGVSWDGRMYVDREVKHDGAAAIRLEVKAGERAVQVSQNVPVSDAVFLAPGRKFRLSAWLKTDRMARANSVNFCFLGARGPGGSLPFPQPEEGWKRVSRDFTVPAGAEDLRIMLHVDGEAKAWVDGLRLEAVGADGAAQEVVLSGRGAYDAFMKRWIGLYHGAARDWLAFGRQVKPPRLVCGTQSYSMTFNGGAKEEAPKPVAFCNAYESLDGRRAVVVVNATAVRQPVTLYGDGRRENLTLEPDEIRILKR